MTTFEYLIFIGSSALLPIILIIVGAFLWKFPPAYDSLWGYKTNRSGSSEEAWYAAQELFGKISVLSNLPSLILSVVIESLSLPLRLDEDTAAWILVGIGIVQTLIVLADIAAVEILLAKRFDHKK